MNSISCTNLTKDFYYIKSFRTFKKKVLDNISIEFEKSNAYLILGDNGAGKSTYLKILLGFIKPSSGSYTIFGENDSLMKKYIGYIPEVTQLLDNNITGKQYLQMFGYLNGLDKNIILEQIDRFSTIFNINDYLGQKMRYYSKGILRKFDLLRSLLHTPKILLLDEPLYGLDINTRNKFLEFYNSILEDTTIIITTHDILTYEKLLSKVLVLNNHKLS
jgi:ABC-2 type transport system ATP-binding protein